MAISLNHGVVQGRVAAINAFENNVRVTVAVDDDYKDASGQMVDRSYFVSISFFGESQMERLMRMASKGAMITIEYKLTSYIPKNSQYHTVSITGTAFYVGEAGKESSGTNQQPQRRAPQNSNRRPQQQPEKQAESEEDMPW